MTKDGVGQLAFTFVLEGAKDEAETTQDPSPMPAGAGSNGLEAPLLPAAVGGKPPRKQKAHSLIDKVYAPKNLQAAWERVKANGGAPGRDGMTIERFGERAEERLAQLSQDLRAKTYRPQPVRRVFIPKGDGGQRPLGIPTVRDRIVQQALLQVLEPVFEGKFSHRSHGFRKGFGCASALKVVDQAVRHGYGWVVDADIQSFFDTVDHEKLLDTVNEEVADGSVLRLIRRILTAGVQLPETAAVEPTELGTPQGGPLSPLLANVYLHRLDVALSQAGYGLVRYADDFVIFAKSEQEAAAALHLARQILEGELGLTLHPEKTRVVSVPQGFEFLGFRYYGDTERGTIRKEVRGKSVRRFRDTVRRLTPRLHNQTLPKRKHLTLRRLRTNLRIEAMMKGLAQYLPAWHWYFKSVWTEERYFQRYDQFVRRRVRTAITGRTGSGGWMNAELPNCLLAALGLVSLVVLNRPYRQDPWDSAARKGEPGGEPYAGKPHVRFGKAGGRATVP